MIIMKEFLFVCLEGRPKKRIRLISNNVSKIQYEIIHLNKYQSKSVFTER